MLQFSGRCFMQDYDLKLNSSIAVVKSKVKPIIKYIKMKKLMFVLFVSLIGLSSQAQEKKKKNARHDVEVNGSCEMCKKRIEKAAYSVPGVKSAEWHADDTTLHLIINEEKCSTLDVKNAVAKAGHDTDVVKASDEDYEKLHTCCSYERL